MKFRNATDISNGLKAGEDLVILDIREDYELEICKIESLHIPMAEVVDRIQELPVNKEIVILCRSGQRAEALGNILETDLNMNSICILEGGIMAWRDAVNPELEAY